MSWQYHEEWLKLLKQNLHRRWEFLNTDIVEPILRQNPHYVRCTEREDNSGICKQVHEFRRYVEEELRPPKEPGIDYGETAYTLWMLGIRFPKYAAALQARVNEFFIGSTYYESGISGFRQLLYEAQGMCRLIEAGMEFEDLHAEQGEPDFLVSADDGPFYLEVKLPVSNLEGRINKSFRQLRPSKRPRTALLVGLDSVLQRKGAGTLREHLELAREKVRGKRTVIAVEFPERGSTEGGVSVDLAYDEERHDAGVLAALRRMVLCDP
jgi:hypothetical protein